MRYKQIVFVNTVAIAAIFLSACATTTDGPIRDRYGLMSLELPPQWIDATADFRRQSDAAHSFGRLRNDTGIRLLLYVTRRDHGICMFRELTYTPGDEGYTWNLQKLNHEVANARNHVLGYSYDQFVHVGILPPASYTKATSIQLRLSGRSTSTRFHGWQHRYRYEFNRDQGSSTSAETWVLSMRFASDGTSAKRYLIAECSMDARGQTYLENAASVEKLLESVDFDGDRRFVAPPGEKTGKPEIRPTKFKAEG
jgi:hypothetical protein